MEATTSVEGVVTAKTFRPAAASGFSAKTVLAVAILSSVVSASVWQYAYRFLGDAFIAEVSAFLAAFSAVTGGSAAAMAGGMGAAAAATIGEVATQISAFLAAFNAVTGGSSAAMAGGLGAAAAATIGAVVVVAKVAAISKRCVVSTARFLRRRPQGGQVGSPARCDSKALPAQPIHNDAHQRAPTQAPGKQEAIPQPDVQWRQSKVGSRTATGFEAPSGSRVANDGRSSLPESGYSSSDSPSFPAAGHLLSANMGASELKSDPASPELNQPRRSLRINQDYTHGSPGSLPESNADESGAAKDSALRGDPHGDMEDELASFRHARPEGSGRADDFPEENPARPAASPGPEEQPGSPWRDIEPGAGNWQDAPAPGLQALAASDMDSVRWEPSVVYQLMEIRGDMMDGTLVEKVVIPRPEIVKLCNDAVPRSCSKNASKIAFAKLNGVAQQCYGVVGHRAAILSLLTKVGALDVEGARLLLESCPPGIYGVVKRQIAPPKGPTEPFGEGERGSACLRQVIFVVLWPRPDAFSSISPNSISSSCVRYITQLTRHVFFCFDREGTLAFPSGEHTCSKPTRFDHFTFEKTVTKESFDLLPGFTLHAAASGPSQLQRGGSVRDSCGMQSPMTMVTGARGLAGVVYHVALPPVRVWKNNVSMDFDLDARDKLLQWREQHKVELHADMPIAEKKLLLQSLAADPSSVQRLARSQQEELDLLRKKENEEVAQLKAGLDAKQEDFRQQMVQAFRYHLLVSDPIGYELAVDRHALEETRSKGAVYLQMVQAEVGNPSLQTVFRELASDFSVNLIKRCCLVAAVVACPSRKDTRFFLAKPFTGPPTREDPLSEAQTLWSRKDLEHVAKAEGVCEIAAQYRNAGYPVMAFHGNPKRSPEEVRSLLQRLVRDKLASAILKAENSLERKLAHGALSVLQRATEKARQIKQAYVDEIKRREDSHLQQLAAAAFPSSAFANTDKLSVVVRSCRELARRGGYTAGTDKKSMLAVAGDVEEQQEPLVELQVALFSSPQQQGHQGGAASAARQAPVVSRVGHAQIPASLTVLSSFLMKKGRSLLVAANTADDRARVDVYGLSSGGQRAFNRVFGRRAELVDFDEDTRLLAFYIKSQDQTQHLVSVSRFDEGFKAMESACPQVELTSLNGSSELLDLALLRTQRKVVLLDKGGRVRMYNIQQKAMEREVYQSPRLATFSPTTLLVTATGNCVMLVCRDSGDAAPDTKQADAMPDMPTARTLQVVPLMLPGLHVLPMKEIEHYGSSPAFASFSLGGGGEGASLTQFLGIFSAKAGTLDTHHIQVQAREQADRIEVVGKAGNAGNKPATQDAAELTMLEYLFHAYDKFAVVGAAVEAEEGLNNVAMHLAVVLDHEEGQVTQDYLSKRVAMYIKGIERRLTEGHKPGVGSLNLSRNLVVLPAAAISKMWVPGPKVVVPAANDLGIDVTKVPWLMSAMATAQDMGDWVKQLICLLPLQIARAEDNSFVLMADGVQVSQHLRSTQEAIDAIGFGLLDAVLDSWWGEIAVVSSMGKQSTGKSYTLNHLFGTSFQISGARCTDGCWMGLCQVGSVLYVILDFEGLGSFERTEQEDMLLAVFNAAVSNYTLFKTEFRLDRDLEAMFSRFQSGTGLLKGDERLFKGCFCIVVKDVAGRDVESVNQEFRSKISLITRPREGSDVSDNFIKGMYGGEFAIFSFPPLGQPDFYSDLGTIFQTIAERPKQFASGGASFSSFMKHLMSKLIMKDWTTLEGQNVLNRVQYLARHVDTAISHGCLSTSQGAFDGALEEEALSSLDTGQAIESHELAVTLPDGQGAGVPVVQVPDTLIVLRDKDQEALIQKLLEVFCKDVEVGRPQWEKAFLAFVKAVVDRRCSRVQEWVDANLIRLQGEDGRLDDCAVRFMDDVASKLQVLRNEWQLCGSTCSHCFMSCLLPKSHPAAIHTCMGLHTCKSTCWFCEEAEAEDPSANSVLYKCEEKMGHGGTHCCKQKAHTCQASCSMAGSLNCNSTCCKKAGHEHLPGGGGHICNSPMHLCGAPCSASNCRGRCQINADKTHSVHKCAEVMCLHGCAVKDCTYTCSSRDHFHHTALSQQYLAEAGGVGQATAGQGAAEDDAGLHFCGREHPCSEQCESEGICRLSIQHVNDVEEDVFIGARSTFTYQTVAEANGKREECAIRIPPFKLHHEGPHTHSLDPRVVHTCSAKCPTCLYFCELPFGHYGNHKGAHGMMRTCHWVSDRNEIDVGDRKYVSGESGQAEMCNMFCQSMGQGHIHIMTCDAEDPNQCTYSSSDGRRHETCKYGPDEDIPKDELTHAHYWETIGWHDNCSAAERELFAKCSHRCGAPEHEEGGSLPVFCELDLWHDPADKAMAMDGQSVSADGHLFACKHRGAAGSGYHVVFALDSSGSMSGQPWQDLLRAVTGFVAQRVSKGAKDLVSVVVYENSATIHCEGIPIANCPVNSLPFYNGGTNFAAALLKAEEVIARVHAREGGTYTPLLLFMSDGQDDSGTAEMNQLHTRFGVDGLIVYTVGFGRSNFSMLKSLAQTGQGTFENSVDGIALVNTFAQIATSMAQKASLMPSNKGRQMTSQGIPEFMASVPQPFSAGLTAGLKSMASGSMLEASRLFERIHAAAGSTGVITDALLLLLVCRTKLNDDGVKAEAAKLMETWDGFAHLTVTELFGVAALLDYLPGNTARKKAAHTYAKLFVDMDCGPDAFWTWFKDRAREIVSRTAPMLGARGSAPTNNPQPKALTVSERWQQIVAKDSTIAIPAMNELLQMTGLEAVKEQFLGIYHWVRIAKRRGESLHEKRLNVVLSGNPGTGKTTVARLYGSFLVSLGALSGDAMEETSGAKLVQGGVDELKKLLEAIEKKGGGVLFIDEAYQLNPQSEMYGRRVLDYLLAEVENKIGKLVVALAGYKTKMEQLFEHNEGLPERFPYKFTFEDYDDSELMGMLQKRIVKKIPSPDLLIEGGMDGKPMRILIRRLGQGRGKEGFGNARAVANLWDKIMVRQATRLASESAKGIPCNDYEFKREDLLGPNVRLALNNSAAYKALQGMIGMTAVKAAVDGLVKVIETNVEREEREEPLLRMSLNRLFLGNPGTGKTTVAKHYAGILKDLGLLSKGEVIIKNPSDFIGGHLGQSEEKTTGILKSAAGNVLVIDEAYGLFSSGFAGSGQDPYKESVIDTIVAKVQNVPGEDLAVLMLGYQKQMEEFLTKANPGLARRFALEDAFVFEDYKDDELLLILTDKLAQKGLQAGFPAKRAAVEHLAKQRRRPNFGNGGAVENLISSAVTRMNARLGAMSPVERARAQELTAEDFDPDLATVSLVNGGDLSSFFSELVGCEAAKKKLAEYKAFIELAHKRGQDPLQDLNLCFRFEGAPGTGKTTVARKMGQIFKSLGILGDGGVVEVSATDLIGQYVGQTGPKTRDKLREALDRVLFIDEAYRLKPGHNSFASEALNEMVDALTKPEFHNKLVVILAGYPREIHELVQSNSGLSSRFKEIVLFEDFTPDQCLAMLKEKLKGAYALPPGMDEEIKAHFAGLMKVAGWGNGRDVEGLRKDFQKRAAHRIMSTNAEVPAGGIIQLERDDIFPALEQLLRERTAYAPQEPRQEPLGAAFVATSMNNMNNPPRSSGNASQATCRKDNSGGSDNKNDKNQGNGVKKRAGQRDAGVTDEAWARLQHRQDDEERRRAAEEEEKRRLEEEAKKLAERLRLEHEAREQARLEEELRRLQEQLQAIEAAQREEMRRQQRLRELGRCCAGYDWIRISDTMYQCAGGSHFASVAELA
eukprot:jgi/Mesvir1/20795/Mv07900-RA.2